MTIRTSLVTLATATALMAVSATTLADSPREWGYWDAATAAGPGTGGNDGFSKMTYSQNINNANNNNNGGQLNNEQNTTRLGRDVFIPDTGEAGTNYVTYNICLYGCDNRRGSRLRVAKTAGKAYAKVTPNADATSAQLQLAGDYNGNSFKFFDNNAYLYTHSHGDHSQTVVGSKRPSLRFWSIIEQTYAGKDVGAYSTGHMGIDNSFGFVLLGKPITATEIAKQLRIGQTYHFAGRSFYGSDVNIKVNFQKAKWNGSWSSQRYHNGFKAKGAIKGSTLISNKVKGFGKKGAVGFVKKGVVDATLVGVINGKDATKAAVIGKTILTVKKRRGTKKVADIFAAQGVAKAPKIVKPAIVK